MKALLLLAFALPATLGASLPPSDKPFTCTEEEKEAAAKVAELFINDHHHRGYKFRLQSILSAKVEKKGTSECRLDLELSLGETKCHIIDPKALDKCEIREFHDGQVNAKCTVTVKESEGKATIEKFACSTDAVPAVEIARVCPDCPSLIPLHDPQGLESVKQAVKKFNADSTHGSYFRLMEVGRMSSQWMFMGMSIFADFAIAETDCASDTKPESLDDCLTLCDDKARHGLCESTLLGNGEVDVQCQIFDAKNDTIFHHHPPPVQANCTKPPHPPPSDTAPLPPFHQLPQTRPAGPPPGHAGPPGPAGRPGPHARPGTYGLLGPPGPDAKPQGNGHFFPQCPGVVKIPPTIHPICPYPIPVFRPPPEGFTHTVQAPVLKPPHIHSTGQGLISFT